MKCHLLLTSGSLLISLQISAQSLNLNISISSAKRHKLRTKYIFFNSIFFKRHLKWFQIQFFFVNCSCHWINWQSKKSCFVNSENLVVSIFVHLRMSRKLFYANLKMMHLCKFFKIPFCIF